jgi:hypothetical protein
MSTQVYEIETYEVSLQRDNLLGCLQGRNGAGDFFLVYFTDNPTAPNSFHAPTRTAVSYMPSSTFTWYLDLLRNEGPVYAHVDDAAPFAHRLCTSKEPVGEGERLGLMSHS